MERKATSQWTMDYFAFRPSLRRVCEDGVEIKMSMRVWGFHEFDSSNTSAISSHLSVILLEKVCQKRIYAGIEMGMVSRSLN
jgi:hypothetical protein